MKHAELERGVQRGSALFEDRWHADVDRWHADVVGLWLHEDALQVYTLKPTLREYVSIPPSREVANLTFEVLLARKSAAP